jgi:uncharacterized membrane protein ArfC
MQDLNWWLMALAFLLGLILTLFLLIRRVKREVPKLDVDAAGDVAKPGAVAAGAAAAGVAGGAAAAKFAGSSTEAGTEPYGPGSARVSAGAVAPSGYGIKGNEDSMLYHTTDSPSYKQTIAEIWFRDEPTAEAAGFHRWDGGKSERGKR